MQPDRAHRSLNTILLVMLMAMVSINANSPVEAGLWENIHVLGVSIALLAMIVILVKLGADHLEEIQQYLGFA